MAEEYVDLTSVLHELLHYVPRDPWAKAKEPCQGPECVKKGIYNKKAQMYLCQAHTQLFTKHNRLHHIKSYGGLSSPLNILFDDFWSKRCGKGGTVYVVEASTWEEANELMSEFFVPHKRGDGLYSHCRACQASNQNGRIDTCADKIQMLNQQDWKCLISEVPLTLRTACMDHGPNRLAAVTNHVNMMIGNGNIEIHEKILTYLRKAST